MKKIYWILTLKKKTSMYVLLKAITISDTHGNAASPPSLSSFQLRTFDDFDEPQGCEFSREQHWKSW